MTHEFRELIHQAYSWQQSGLKTVLASVVALDGSSYRRPGVRMLICETGEMAGAVSGGCVEKDIARQAQTVLSEGSPKMMTYDGRFRLGCEGMLYILLEPIYISDSLYNQLQWCFEQRDPFSCATYFQRDVDKMPPMGTSVHAGQEEYSLSPGFSLDQAASLEKLKQEFPPIFQLYIFGAEHDAVQLSRIGSQLGWDVHIIASADEQKSLEYFEGARSIQTPVPDQIDVAGIDGQTAVILMSHSFHKDFRYLLALRNRKPAYLGLLGPEHRRERLFSELLNSHPEISYEFLEDIHGPAGIHIGAESAPEIAVSIVSEILSVVRKADPQPLREKGGRIHE